MLSNSKRQPIIIPLLLILMIDAMGFGLVIPVLNQLIMSPTTSILPITATESTRHFYFALTLGLFPIAVFLGTPILGLLSDRYGRKVVLLGCLAGAVLGAILAAQGIIMKQVSLLLIGRFLSGLCSASQPIAQAAITDISKNNQKAIYLSLVAFAMTVGMAGGPLLGGFFANVSLYSLPTLCTPFILSGILSLLSIFVVITLFKETNLSQTKHTWRFTENLRHSVTIFANPLTRKLIYCFLLIELAWSLYFQSMPLQLASHYAFTSKQIALFITYLAIFMCIGLSLLFPLIVKKLPLQKITQYSFIACAIGLTLCVLKPELWAQWIFTIPLTIGVGIGYTSILSLLSNQIAKNLQGWLMGFAQSLLALAWATTSFIASFLTYFGKGLNIIVPIVIILLGYYFAKKVQLKSAALTESTAIKE